MGKRMMKDEREAFSIARGILIDKLPGSLVLHYGEQGLYDLGLAVVTINHCFGKPTNIKVDFDNSAPDHWVQTKQGGWRQVR